MCAKSCGPSTSLTFNQMHATRLTGIGKPKVVTIARPMALSTTSTSMFQEFQSQDRPSTPIRPCQDISVFSPDTPVKHSRRSPTWSSTSLRPAALTPRRHHRHKSSTPLRSSSGYGQSGRDSLELSPSQSQDTFAASFSSYTIAGPMRTPPPVLSPTNGAVAWSSCRKLEGILEAVSQAIKSFPDGMLCLDSPAILALRTPHSLDEMHIDALQRVFPRTASLLLSALAALLIVDSFFSSLGENCTLSSSLPHRPSERKHDKLAAQSNECLHDIPMKARATLGTHLPNVTRVQDHEQALKRRADMVAVCVRVQGQKLLEAICGRFDEVMWRALKVLVDTLEGKCL